MSPDHLDHHCSIALLTRFLNSWRFLSWVWELC